MHLQAGVSLYQSAYAIHLWLQECPLFSAHSWPPGHNIVDRFFSRHQFFLTVLPHSLPRPYRHRDGRSREAAGGWF